MDDDDWLVVAAVQDDFALTSPYASDDDEPRNPEVREPEELDPPVSETVPALPPALPQQRAAPTARPVPVHLWFGVIVVMAALRIVGAPRFPLSPPSTPRGALTN